MINNVQQLSRSLVGIYHWREIKYERFGGRHSVGERPEARPPPLNPALSGAEPQRKSNLVHFSLEI